MFWLHNEEFSQLIRRKNVRFFSGLIFPLLQSSVFHQVHCQTVPCSSFQEHWFPHSRIQHTVLTELYFCFKTIPFELSNDANNIWSNALTVYGPSDLFENFTPFLCLRLFSNGDTERCRRSKSRFCFSCAFLCF